MKKIFLLYIHNGTNIAGGERSLLALLNALDKNQFTPIIACPDNAPFSQELKKQGYSTIMMNFPRLRQVFKLRNTVNQLKRIVLEKNICLIHSNSPQTNLPAALAGRSNRIPVVWHARVLVEKGMFDIDRWLSHLPDKIICNCDAIRRRFLGIKDYATKTVSIINGVDPQEFAPDNPLAIETRGQLNIAEDAAVIGCFDRLDPVKNHEFILDAFAKVVQNITNAVLIIVGDAFENKQVRLNQLRQKAKSLNIDNKIIFKGFLKDVRPVMAACDCVLQASKSEGCSRALCEAQAMGKAVVASNIGGNPEIVDNGKTGYIFDVTDAQDCAGKLISILRDSALKQVMQNNARQWALTHLSVEKNCAQTQNLYKELLNL